MAALPLNLASIAGGTVIDDHLVAAAALGDTVPVGPRRFLYVKNGSGASVTVTVVTPGDVSGLAVADATLVLAAGKSGAIPLPRLTAGADGRASITYSAVTTVTVGVFELVDA
ncbi:hypothetical protein [Streptomyces sp.]|uniref:hypothetical protein n=1 Tax=Streptomyces sp. TaxID=1931 RepID=UPI002F3F4C10